MRLFRGGGFSHDGLDDQIVLHGEAETAGYYSWFQKSGAAAGAYQVPVGKSFYVTEVSCSATGGSAFNVAFSIGYADNAVASYHASSFSPTNPIEIFGNPTYAGFTFMSYLGLYGPVWRGSLKAAPATKYPFLTVILNGSGGRVSVLVTGFEA